MFLVKNVKSPGKSVIILPGIPGKLYTANGEFQITRERGEFNQICVAPPGTRRSGEFHPVSVIISHGVFSVYINNTKQNERTN